MESQQIVGLITILDETGEVLKIGVYPRYQNAVDTVKLTALSNPGWKIEQESSHGLKVSSPTGCAVIAELVEANGLNLIDIKELWPKEINKEVKTK